MVRGKLFEAIVNEIGGDGNMIKKIDLWHHNVEFIEQEDAWERPAVFVEFDPIHCEKVGKDSRATATHLSFTM